MQTTRETQIARILRGASRRTFLRRVGLTAVSLVAVTFARLGLPAPIALAGLCHTCYGNCHPCMSCVWNCPSPDSVFFCSNCGSCPEWEAGTGSCGMFRVWVSCCTDGSMTSGYIPC